MGAKAVVSVRLDAEVRAALTRRARARGMGLSTFIARRMAEEAVEAGREETYQGALAVAAHIAASPDARAFVEDWCGGDLPDETR